jgi:hypothetical protein
MLRQVFLRTAASVGRRVAVQSAPRIAAPALTSRLSTPALLRQPRVASVAAVRCYSAAAGLKKDEVEGRIMELLKGFDKVCLTSHDSAAFRARCLCFALLVGWLGADNALFLQVNDTQNVCTSLVFPRLETVSARC